MISGMDTARAHTSKTRSLVRSAPIDHGANPNARNPSHWTLMLATASGYPGIVKLLLKRGADVQARTDEGETQEIERLRIYFGSVMRKDQGLMAPFIFQNAI